MKTLTATAEDQCSSRYNEPALLLEIDWSENDTGRYADRAVIVGGLEYAGVISGIGPIRCLFDSPASEIRPITVTLAPSASIAGALATSVPEGKAVRIRLFFENTDEADVLELFAGYVAKLARSGPDSLELELRGLFEKHDRLLPRDLVSPTDFPKALSGDIGKPLPVVFGAVPDAPTLGAQIGRTANLHGSILSGDATIEVDDATGFPPLGALLIEAEEITYTGISGNVFTGCVRGANGTHASDHLNRREVIEHMAEHVYLVAGHACRAVENVKIDGAPVEMGACEIDCNNTGLVPGKSLTTITFVNRPRARRYSSASRFLEMQFDATAGGNEAVHPEYCYDTSLEGFATLAARISGAPANDTLRIRQTTDVSGYGAKYGEILKAFLMVEHFESSAFTDDYLSVVIAGQTFKLAKPSEEDTAGGGGEVDVDHGHSHSISGEHTHAMTVKKESVFTNVVVQTGGTTGSWSEIEDIAGDNLSRSGFTTQPNTDRSLQCNVASSTVKGSVQRIQFCCRRGESGMAGSFILRFYRNGALERQYTIGGTSSPETWKSGWEAVGGFTWSDLQAPNTYLMVTPLTGNTQNIRLFGAWFELEYLEQPDAYQGSGVKDSSDVTAYSAANAHVINEEPISSTSVVEGVDITGLVAGDWGWLNNREAWINYNVVSTDDGVSGYVLHAWFDIEYAPFEEITSDKVTCDAQGIETAGDGSGALIENPADAIKRILTGFLGFDETHIDADSFAAAWTALEAAGARFAFALLEQKTASNLLTALAEQARCRLAFDAGKFRLIYRPDVSGEPSSVVLSGNTFSGSSRIESAGIEKVLNKIVGYHTRDYSRRGSLADKYSNFSVAENTQSQATYGARETTLELFALRDAAYAQGLLDFLAAREADPPRRYVWRSFLRDVALERGDIVEICDLEAGLFKARGEIVESTFVAGSARREIDTIAFAAELESHGFLWSAAGNAYLRLTEDALYFVVEGELVARLANNGILYLKGFVIDDQLLPAASGNPLSYDSGREAIAFALSDDTRVMELNASGNLLAPLTPEYDQALTLAGSADEIASDTAALWANIGNVRAMEVTAAGLLRLPGHVVENCNWETLYG